MAIRVDVTTVLRREADISRNLRQLSQVCEKETAADDLCPLLTDSVSRMVGKIEEGMGTVFDLVQPDAKRKRRGLVDGLGSIVKAITGNMDAADAERIHGEITAIRSNQQTLREGVRKQLQVVESTLDLFNDTAGRVQANEKALAESVTQIRDSLTANLFESARRRWLDEGLTAVSVMVETG